jgi:hypothetical protein
VKEHTAINSQGILSSLNHCTLDIPYCTPTHAHTRARAHTRTHILYLITQANTHTHTRTNAHTHWLTLTHTRWLATKLRMGVLVVVLLPSPLSSRLAANKDAHSRGSAIALSQLAPTARSRKQIAGLSLCASAFATATDMDTDSDTDSETEQR